METFIALLVPFLIVGTLFGSVIYYVWATSEKDALYFMRRHQFKQKVLENGYNSTWDLVDSLIHTSAKDWTKTKYHMYYKPFPGTTMWFKDSLGLNVEIVEGSGNKQVFDVHYFDDTDEVAYGFDYTTGKYLTQADKFRMKKLLLHLKEIHDTLKSDTYQRQQNLLQQEEQGFLEKKKEKKQQLRLLLREEVPLEAGYRQYDFLLQFKKEKNYQTLLISFEDTLYFQALQMVNADEVDTTFHNVSNQQAEIFTEIKSELIYFSKKIFEKQSVTTVVQKAASESVEEPFQAAFEADYNDKLRVIYSLTASLKEEKEWLSVEALHQITETFPKDLHALSEVYRVIKDKDKVQRDVESSLQTMVQKLEVFVDEAECNKQLAIKKSKLVIEKR